MVQESKIEWCTHTSNPVKYRDAAREHSLAPGARDEMGRFAPGNMRLRIREFPAVTA